MVKGPGYGFICMVPYLAEKRMPQLIIWMSYRQQGSHSHFQGQMGGAGEAAELVEMRAKGVQTSCLRSRLLFSSRPLLSCGSGVLLLPGLLSFQNLQTHILNKIFQFLNSVNTL